MKTIYRFQIKELFCTFCLCLLTLNFLLMMEKILRISRILSGMGASIKDLMVIILYLQPSLMVLTVPMSLLLSTLLTYGRMNADNELVILRASGLSFKSISWPVFFSGSVAFILCLILSFSISPLSSKRLRDSLARIIIERAPQSIEPGVFNTSFKDLVILVRERPSKDTVKGIFIYDSRKKNEPRVLVAKEGVISAGHDFNVSMFLNGGYIHIAGDHGESTEIFFDRYHLSLSINSESPTRKNAELTPFELLKEAKGKDKGEKINLMLEFQRRLTLPFLSLVLMFLGPPLSLLSGKSGRLGGLTIGIATFTVFYIMIVYTENLARSGMVHYLLGAWLPVVIFGLVSIVVFIRTHNKL